jgi:hypothetical protein
VNPLSNLLFGVLICDKVTPVKSNVKIPAYRR